MSPPRRSPETTGQLRAGLVAHAQRLIARDGPGALTMRALAAEAGCAIGLPYKVFADRGELIGEVLHAEFVRLSAAVDRLIDRVGRHSVGTNLMWFAELLLDSPAVALAPEVVDDPALATAFTARVHETGFGPGGFENAFADYLAAEKRAGRVAADVDERTFGFLLAGAIHNLVMSGDAYPKPSRPELKRLLASTAAAIAPRQPTTPTNRSRPR